MSNIKTFETYLPVFPGFYNTIFDGDYLTEIWYDDIASDRKFLRLPPAEDDLEFDWDKYNLEVSEQVCSILYDYLCEFVEDIEFQSLSSPKYYNFSNDSINCKITLDVDKLAQFIKDNWEEFQVYIRDKYTSRDGFMSFKDNDAEKWAENTNRFTDYLDGHELGSLLQFVCDVLKIDQYKIHQDLEVYLDCTNSDFETYKIQCPECSDWFVDKDIVKKWNDQINFDLKDIESFGIKPKLRDFNEWMKNNELNCGCD